MKQKNYAVLEIGTKQYLVREGDLLKVDSVNPEADVKVLLSKVDGTLEIGTPYVSSVGVEMDLIENKKDTKISVMRFKSKSRYRKNVGHRQPVSILKVSKVANGLKSKISEAKKPAKKSSSKGE